MKFKVNSCKDGKQRPVESFFISSPIGNLLLQACCEGLHVINQVEEICDENFNPMPDQPVVLLGKPSTDKSTDVIVQASVAWLKAYFFEPSKIMATPLPQFCKVRENGKFHEHVQLRLASNVQFGQTVSYKDLAALTRSPGAFQAVGSAMKNNPFQLMVPCHRVINSGSKLGVYSGGRRNKTKEWLLNHEGLQVSNGVVIK